MKIAVCFLVLFWSCSKDEVDINNIAEFEEYIEDEMSFQKIPAMSSAQSLKATNL